MCYLYNCIRSWRFWSTLADTQRLHLNNTLMVVGFKCWHTLYVDVMMPDWVQWACSISSAHGWNYFQRLLFIVSLTFTPSHWWPSSGQWRSGKVHRPLAVPPSSPFYLSHVRWSNEADSCSLNWNVPAVSGTLEGQRQCHLHIQIHFKSELE